MSEAKGDHTAYRCANNRDSISSVECFLRCSFVLFCFFPFWIAPFDVVVMTFTLYSIEGKLMKEH